MNDQEKYFEVRVPITLIMAPIANWIKLIWIAMKSFQGTGNSCYASLKSIGNRCPSDKYNCMDKGQVSRGQKVLEEHGFLERLSDGTWYCISHRSIDLASSLSHISVDSPSTFASSGVDHQSTAVDSPSTKVDHQSTAVDPQSTPSNNQPLKPNPITNLKTNTPVVPYSEVMESWNAFAERSGVAVIKKMSDKRKEFVRVRYDEVWPLIEDVYSVIQSDSFYTGGGPRGWEVDFDHVWGKRDAALKIAEKFKNRKSNGTKNRNGKASNGKPRTDWNELAFGKR